MNKDEIIAFLKENLEIKYVESGGQYGTHVFKVVKLTLCGEEISSANLD